MFFSQHQDRIEEELPSHNHQQQDNPNNTNNTDIIQQKNQPNNEIVVDPNIQSNFNTIFFMPPPITDSSKYLDQLESQFIQFITKDISSFDHITLFGENRDIDLDGKKIGDNPIFVDQQVKVKLKKIIKGIYSKMIENLKYCAGEMPSNHVSPLPKISQKTHQFMMLCQQLKIAQTKTAIWKMMKEQTSIMNRKSQQIQEFLQSMADHCKKQQSKSYFS